MLTIKYLSPDKLIPYVNNSRTHSESQITQVAASIKEFGFTNPILLDEDNGVIAGHGRLLAAKKLGLDSVPTVKLENLTDAQRKAYIIADNKLATNAGWDVDLLSLEMQNLKELDFDLGITGFELEEINALLRSSDEKEFEYDFDDDEESQPTKTVEGYAEFSVVLQQENKDKVLELIQQMKFEHNTTSTEEAFMALVLR